MAKLWKGIYYCESVAASFGRPLVSMQNRRLNCDIVSSALQVSGCRTNPSFNKRSRRLSPI